MPRIPQYLRKHAIGMVNAGMMMNAVAMNIGCSTRVILHLRQGFQATERMDDRPHSGLSRITMCDQDCYILYTHLRNCF